MRATGRLRDIVATWQHAAERWCHELSCGHYVVRRQRYETCEAIAKASCCPECPTLRQNARRRPKKPRQPRQPVTSHPRRGKNQWKWGTASHWNYRSCPFCSREYPDKPVGSRRSKAVRADETYLRECPWCGVSDSWEPYSGVPGGAIHDFLCIKAVPLEDAHDELFLAGHSACLLVSRAGTTMQKAPWSPPSNKLVVALDAEAPE